jgi:hypothetical protein
MTPRRPSIEDVARAVLGRPEPEREDRGPKPTITLPRIEFLERPLPSWWDEPPPRKPIPTRKRRTS